MDPTSTRKQASGMLIDAVEKVLQQVLGILLGRMSFPKFVDLARKVFVEEAERKLRKETGKRNVPLTELGLLTGIDTRSLSRVRNSSDFDRPMSESETFFLELTPEAAIVDMWRTHPDFLDQDTGEPLRLDVFGPSPSFESLVTSTVKSRGITVQSILNRLVKSESVGISKSGEEVQLKSSIWMHYSKLDVEGAYGSGLTGVSRHLDTVIKNIRAMTGEGEPRFERLFWTTRLAPEKEKLFKDKITKFLEESSEEATELIAPFDRNHSLPKRYTAGVGFYYFDSKEE